MLLLCICLFSYAVMAEPIVFTREAAMKMMVSLVRDHRQYGVWANPFADTSDADITYAKALNLVYGTNNHFYPDDKMTKQDFLLILKRAIDKAAPNIFYDNNRIKFFQEQDAVVPYARYSLNYLTSIDVLRPEDHFRPNDSITYEDAKIYINRAYHAIATVDKSLPGQMPKKLPIKSLLYHQIDDTTNVGSAWLYLFVTPEDFEEQIKYLSESGYTFLFPEEIMYTDYIAKTVVITFDDGMRNNYIYALPILEKYNAKATVFVQTDKIDHFDYCDRDQLCEMNLSGVFRVESHTVTHPKLSGLSPQQMIDEFATSNEILYGITKRWPDSIAYPHGDWNEEVVKQARRYYHTGFSTWKYQKDIMTIPRYYVERWTSIADIEAFLNHK